MAKNEIKVVFLIGFLLLLLNFFQIMMLLFFLKAKRIKSCMLQPLFTKIALIVGLIHFWPFRFAKDPFVELHIVDRSPIATCGSGVDNPN